MRAKKGIYAAAITPVGPDGKPDAEALAIYCRRLIDAGLDGVAPLGTTGEGNSLPLSFRTKVPGHLAEAGLRGDEVIIGTGACAAGDAVEATKAALDAGLNNVLMLPPFYYKSPSDAGLFDYYSAVIDGVGDDRLRVYLYHFPQMSSVPISVALVERLRKAFGPTIAGLKDSSGDFSNSESYVRAIADFDVYPSTESLLLRGQESGMAGVISATTNISPSLAAATFRATSDQAGPLQSRLADVRETISGYPLIPAVKQLAAWHAGNDELARVLPPMQPLSTDQLEALRGDFDRLNRLGDLMAPTMKAA